MDNKEISEKPKDNPLGILNFSAVTILIVLFVFILKEMQSILLPLFVAILITFAFLPLYNFLIKKKVPAALSLIIIILILLILVNSVSIFIITSINSFSQEFPKYEAKFLHFYHSLLPALNLSPDELSTIEQFFNIKNLLLGGNLTSAITGILTNITSLLGNFILIIFYIIFLLTESDSIGKRFSIAFSEEKNASLKYTLEHIIEGLRNYISGKTVLSLLQSLLIGFILWICGVEFYVIWAFLFFITDFIPNIGSMFASVFLTLFMIIQFESILFPVIILAVLILIQNLKGNFLEPKILGARLDLSPFMLFFSLIFWGYVWGVIGMVLSVPIMNMLKIILMNVPSTKYIAILMSNNPDKNQIKI
ncbi:MAG TPA: AI-2E family transporter [Ignavibacteria bacterium]|nr:AI-2E family transporter [Ignavibacteria bacterium]HRJ98069.1 AI-2E family transporter [Ignavibacteria bacterium]